MKKILIATIKYVLIFTLTFFFITKVVKTATVSGDSMYPTIQDGDVLLVSQLNIDADHLERFDIVEIYSTVLQENIIKRIIGLPGDSIVYSDDKLYINGTYVAEDFLDTSYRDSYLSEHTGSNFTSDFTATVGDDEVFVMGDNRPYSTDSRYIGNISISDIFGKRGVVIYPLSRIGWVD